MQIKNKNGNHHLLICLGFNVHSQSPNTLHPKMRKMATLRLPTKGQCLIPPTIRNCYRGMSSIEPVVKIFSLLLLTYISRVRGARPITMDYRIRYLLFLRYKNIITNAIKVLFRWRSTQVANGPNELLRK